MKAKLSVLGLYRWNNEVFSGLVLPDGVDPEVLTWNILEQCAELETIYSDPEYMAASLANWSSLMLPNWTKIQEALTAEYNPIWNKDGTISETNIYGKQHSASTGSASGSGSGTQKVAGYNSDTTHTREENSTTSSSSANDSVTTDAHTDTRTVIEQGNIGVTESSAMVTHEIQLRRSFNIYKIITEDFKNHYCMMVY